MRLDWLILSLAVSAVRPEALFDPWSYPESNTRCAAIDRSTEGSEKSVDINISTSVTAELPSRFCQLSYPCLSDYIEVNRKAMSKGTLIMLHGWPGIWSVWARQVSAFQVGFHVSSFYLILILSNLIGRLPPFVTKPPRVW